MPFYLLKKNQWLLLGVIISLSMSYTHNDEDEDILKSVLRYVL